MMTSGGVGPEKERRERIPLLPTKRQDAEEDHGKYQEASFVGSVFNLSTTVIGAGIMALPATIKALGLILGIVFILFVGLLTNVSIMFLLRFSKASKSLSYGGVMADAFGHSGRILLQICTIVNNLGVAIVYMIVIADVLSGASSNGVHHTGVLEEWFGVCWGTGRTVTLLLTTILILAPLVFFRHVDSLKFTSALSLALAVVFVVITAVITIVKLFSGKIHMPRLLPDVVDQASFWKLFTVAPVIVTAFLCHFNVHTIHNELKNTSEMQAIVRTSLSLCAAVYITASLFANLLFGDQTMVDVLANFDTDLGVPYSAVLNDIVRISYAVHLMLVFPLVHFALRLNLDGLIFPSARPLTSDTKRFVLITIGLIGSIFIGATFIPNIWDAFQFTGSTAAACLAFIFPGAIVLRDSHGISTRKDKYLAWIMIVLAVISSLIAISSDIYDLIKRNDVVPSPPLS